jgi:hypothetical protein
VERKWTLSDFEEAARQDAADTDADADADAHGEEEDEEAEKEEEEEEQRSNDDDGDDEKSAGAGVRAIGGAGVGPDTAAAVLALRRRARARARRLPAYLRLLPMPAVHVCLLYSHVRRSPWLRNGLATVSSALRLRFSGGAAATEAEKCAMRLLPRLDCDFIDCLSFRI